MIASVAVLVLMLLFLQQSSGIAPGQLVNILAQWPIEQKLAVIAAAVVLLFLVGVGVWQSDKITQQAKAIASLQKRMSGLRDEIAVAEQSQTGADAALRYLVGSDPITALDEMQQRLVRAEAGAAVAKSQNEAVDLQTRIDEIRQRQQALRSQLGAVSERRRAIEPMLSEIKERQATIERSLSDLEKDESGTSLDAKVKDAEAFLHRGQTRMSALDGLFAGLSEIKTRAEALQSGIDPLRNSETGIKALFTEVTALRNKLDAALTSLEREENEAVADRVQRLAKGKQELESRLGALNDCLNSLESIRGDIGAHFEKLSASLGDHLKRA